MTAALEGRVRRTSTYKELVLSMKEVPSQCKLPGNQTCHTPSRLEMYTGWITCQGTGEVVSAAYVQGA